MLGALFLHGCVADQSVNQMLKEIADGIKLLWAFQYQCIHDGNGYNPSLGVFTVPQDGVYVFSYTVYSSVELNQRLYHKVRMMKNGEVMTSTWEDNQEDGEDSGTQTITVDMQKGDQVYMELKSDRKICKHLELNTFSGYILYASV
ncbi:cerebellin 18 [Syngnathus scovelli]|uniref:cerebellin 18 n=1 Tax=Syngnathus scovelli TaxID=161590 RepID=UPI002110237F|nr:cerebellin 18 [Syngnathus scovelli]